MPDRTGRGRSIVRQPELQPSFRVVEAGPVRVLLRSRLAPGSLRCCGPMAVALAMVAGFTLFVIMQGYETYRQSSTSQCIPFGVGLVALGLTALNVIELMHREELTFDRQRGLILRQDTVVPAVLKFTRARVPFGEVRAVRFWPMREPNWPGTVWGVALYLHGDRMAPVDRASDVDKMRNLAGYLAGFLQVPLLEE